MVVVRERMGRTLTFVTKTEAEGVDIIREVVQQGSVIFADEARHWDVLARDYMTARINHQEAYSENGVHTNYAESFFARARNMIRGFTPSGQSEIPAPVCNALSLAGGSP